MTQITRDDVLYLAQLSNLQLDDAETDDLTEDIGNIVEYIKQLGELDTAGIEPTYQVTDLVNVWRDDAVDPGNVESEQLVGLAAESMDNQIKVPKVLG